VFAWVAVGVFALNLFLPLLVLSFARRPFDLFTFNPWLSRLPEWLASPEVPWDGKLAFLSNMAIAWFIAENPIDGVEWGFIIDVPSLGRLLLTSILFGTYFALWAHRRDQLRECAMGSRAAGQAGVAGALTSILGFSTAPCSVMGCGVPVLPVIGLAFTGLSSGALAFFASFSQVAIWVVFCELLASGHLGRARRRDDRRRLARLARRRCRSASCSSAQRSITRTTKRP